MSSREETQQKMWRGTVQLAMLASSIDRLPEGKTRQEFVTRMDKLITELDAMMRAIDNTGLEICYYGFAPKCPKCGCMECEIFLKKRDAGNKKEEE